LGERHSFESAVGTGICHLADDAGVFKVCLQGEAAEIGGGKAVFANVVVDGWSFVLNITPSFLYRYLLISYKSRTSCFIRTVLWIWIMTFD